MKKNSQSADVIHTVVPTTYLFHDPIERGGFFFLKKKKRNIVKNIGLFKAIMLKKTTSLQVDFKSPWMHASLQL